MGSQVDRSGWAQLGWLNERIVTWNFRICAAVSLAGVAVLVDSGPLHSAGMDWVIVLASSLWAACLLTRIGYAALRRRTRRRWLSDLGSSAEPVRFVTPQNASIARGTSALRRPITRQGTVLVEDGAVQLLDGDERLLADAPVGALSVIRHRRYLGLLVRLDMGAAGTWTVAPYMGDRYEFDRSRQTTLMVVGAIVAAKRQLVANRPDQPATEASSAANQAAGRNGTTRASPPSPASNQASGPATTDGA